MLPNIQDGTSPIFVQEISVSQEMAFGNADLYLTLLAPPTLVWVLRATEQPPLALQEYSHSSGLPGRIGGPITEGSSIVGFSSCGFAKIKM